MKKKFAGFVVLAGVAAAAVAYLTRERMLPRPEMSEEPPPKFRTGSEAAPTEEPEGDDVTTVKGIGPTYATRLGEMGITTRAQLAAADAEEVAAAVGTNVATVKGWQADAAE